MKKTILFMLCLFPLFVSLQAMNDIDPEKTDANVFGHVIDKGTREHLPFATVKIVGTTIGMNTDGTGHYFLKNLPVGKFTLEVSMIGYKKVQKTIVTKAGVSQEVDFELQEEAMNLSEVVVSANRNETNRMLAPSLVSVLDVKMLETTNSKNLFQALNFQPGLRVEDNCQNCGFSQVRINGLDGAYSQILIDSRPIYGALTGVYGLEQIPANMIERVEVIRGGSSALYGSSAIGGVINVITKEPTRNTGSVSHNLSSIGGSALDNNTMFNASMITDHHNMGIMLYGQNRDRQGYDHDGDGFSEMPMLKNRSFGFRSFIKTGVYSKITLEYHNMHEFRRGGDNFKKQPFQAEVTEQLEHFINGGGINYIQNTADLKNKFNLYASAQHTLRKSYYGGGDPITELDPTVLDQDIIDNVNARLRSFGRSTELIYSLGGQYTRNIDNFLFMPAELTTGLEYLNNTLSDVSGYRAKDIDQKSYMTSAFLQNEWRNDHWSILLGGRLDKHSLVKGAIFSPRANIRYNPNGKINFRLSYSEGFRAPQYFDEDLHVALADGEQIVRVLSDDLEEERSRSFSGSIDYYITAGNTSINLLAEGFYTKLYNTFTEVEKDAVTRLIVNADGEGAKVYGVNLEARMAYRKLFDMQLGLTVQKSLFDTPQEVFKDVAEKYREFMRTPNTYGYFNATWRPAERFAATLSGNYTGTMYVKHEASDGVPGKDRFAEKNRVEKSKSFFELHTKLSYDIPIFHHSTLQLNAGVQNIFNAYQDDFDTGPNRASDYIYGPAAPRTYFVGMKMTL